MTWAELVALRWGPGLIDPTPPRIVDRPDPSWRLAGDLWWAAALDDYAVAERVAIQAEDDE